MIGLTIFLFVQCRFLVFGFVHALSRTEWASLVGIWKTWILGSYLNSVHGFYSVLLKNVAAFCPCLKRLLKANGKRYILIALTKEVSEKPSISLWPVVPLMIIVLIKHNNLRKEKYKM